VSAEVSDEDLDLMQDLVAAGIAELLMRASRHEGGLAANPRARARYHHLLRLGRNLGMDL
jgi:hypothetical protein